MISHSSVTTLPVAIRSSSSNVKELSRPKSRRAVLNRHQQLNVPDKSWEASRLGEFARAEQKRLKLYDRNMAVHAYRLGHALWLAYEKVPYGDWGSFLKKFKVSGATDWRARKLFAEAKSEDNLKGLGLMEAYKKYGVNKGQKKPKPASDEQAPPKEPKSLSLMFSRLVNLLDLLMDEAAFVDWTKESKDYCTTLVQEAVAKLTKIGEVIGHD